ncbi:GntR family transcriptional regulator [Devosia rhodophyticola]|uniref:GntR family transcriptional regulator n=1 Tax=Devosia rhodophyticola TaxID=3026423 RepID=A0ABY7YVZ7_9HYPH|nr:GntR family transcriptional regulator [Devosia rhodophyticola]WDR05230.1 GntR family transcriptional regulator [Devosia rhodophyticola]
MASLQQIKAFQSSRRSGQPLYMQVVDHFRQHLTEGLWQPNDVLPSLDVLTETLGVARVTVRDAVKILADEGLLRPERGRGTIVTDKARGHRPLRLEARFDNLNSALRLDRPAVSNIAEGEDVPVIGDLPGTLADSYYFIRRVHLRDDLRYCLISLYLDYAIFDLAPERFRVELAIPVLNEIASGEIAHINQYVRFGKCDEETSVQLEYPAGDPVAHIRRVLRNAEDRIIYYAEVTYRADILEMDTEVHRGNGVANDQASKRHSHLLGPATRRLHWRGNASGQNTQY